jgi:hypothetical protein
MQRFLALMVMATMGCGDATTESPDPTTQDTQALKADAPKLHTWNCEGTGYAERSFSFVAHEFSEAMALTEEWLEGEVIASHECQCVDPNCWYWWMCKGDGLCNWDCDAVIEAAYSSTQYSMTGSEARRLASIDCHESYPHQDCSGISCIDP